jgi:hypothetical protein
MARPRPTSRLDRHPIRLLARPPLDSNADQPPATPRISTRRHPIDLVSHHRQPSSETSTVNGDSETPTWDNVIASFVVGRPRDPARAQLTEDIALTVVWLTRPTGGSRQEPSAPGYHPQ